MQRLNLFLISLSCLVILSGCNILSNSQTKISKGELVFSEDFTDQKQDFRKNFFVYSGQFQLDNISDNGILCCPAKQRNKVGLMFSKASNKNRSIETSFFILSPVAKRAPVFGLSYDPNSLIQVNLIPQTENMIAQILINGKVVASEKFASSSNSWYDLQLNCEQNGQFIDITANIFNKDFNNTKIKLKSRAEGTLPKGRPSIWCIRSANDDFYIDNIKVREW